MAGLTSFGDEAARAVIVRDERSFATRHVINTPGAPI
jgi:hypothetical protein